MDLELQTTAEFVVAFLLQRCGGDDWNLSGRANQNAGEVLHHTNRGGETSRGDHVALVGGKGPVSKKRFLYFPPGSLVREADRLSVRLEKTGFFIVIILNSRSIRPKSVFFFKFYFVSC